MTTPSSRVSDALDNLRVHQRQLDADGIEVGVSREALNEVIRAYGSLHRSLSSDSVSDGSKGVRTLEWVADRAETPFGEYAVSHYDDEGGAGWVFSFDDQDCGNFKSEAEAMAAAQADYAQRILSALSLPTQEPAHPDDLAVDRFASTMKVKLAKKRAEGRRGWERKDECTAEFLSQLLREHVEKGDPVDVGNLAMMLQQRGERITK